MSACYVETMVNYEESILEPVEMLSSVERSCSTLKHVLDVRPISYVI